MRRIYAEMDRELTRETEQAITQQARERPQHAFGVHQYAASDFGLDVAALAERYRAYGETFAVRPEQPE
jgi:hypothetical protein